MKIYKEIESYIEEWNVDSKCGFCWDFRAGANAKDINKHKKTDSDLCCVVVAVFDVGFEYVIDNDYNIKYKRHYCKMFVGLPSRLDEQFYNENKSVIEEGKIEQLCDLELCLNDFDLCESGLNLTSFRAELLTNYLDQNYDGFLINLQAIEYDT